MRSDTAFVTRYIQHLNDAKTTSVFGFDSIVAWAAVIFTTSPIAILVSKACRENTTPGNAASAIVKAIQARICISLGIQNHSESSSNIFNDVMTAVARMTHMKRSFIASSIPAAITALGAFAYNTLSTPPPTLCELALGILAPSLLVLLTSLVACTIFLPDITIVIHTASGTKTIKVQSDSPYYELLRLFAKSLNNPNNLSFTYAIQDIADKVSLKYRIPHLHSMSDSLDGIPDQYVFEHESKEHPFHTTPMSSTNDDITTPTGV